MRSKGLKFYSRQTLSSSTRIRVDGKVMTWGFIKRMYDGILAIEKELLTFGQSRYNNVYLEI